MQEEAKGQDPQLWKVPLFILHQTLAEIQPQLQIILQDVQKIYQIPS